MPAKTNRLRSLETCSSEETFLAGVDFAQTLQGDEIVALFGELGSGKTTFLKGVISDLAECHPDEISSPTFNYLNVYCGKVLTYHFDLYRLRNEDEFEKAGFKEYFSSGVCCLEWAEKITLPTRAIRIHLHYTGASTRLITIE